MVQNNQDVLLDKFLTFKQTYMPDECILDVINEYAIKIDLEPEELANLLSDNPTFIKIVEANLEEFKFIKKPKENIDFNTLWA